MSQSPYFTMNFSHQNAHNALKFKAQGKTMSQKPKFFFTHAEKTPNKQGKFDD